MRVYLAGGFKSGWQKRVKAECPNLEYFDPSEHELQSVEQFIAWDLLAIKQCDAVFAYLEQDNPGGYALALEIGYAKALGKAVIFVDEKSPKDANMARQLRMVHEVVSVSADQLAWGLAFLRKFDEKSASRAPGG